MKKYNYSDNIDYNDSDDLLYLIKNTKIDFEFVKKYILNNDSNDVPSLDVIYAYQSHLRPEILKLINS